MNRSLIRLSLIEHVVALVAVEGLIVDLVEALSTLQVPKLVEKGVVSLSFESLNHSVEVALTHKAVHLLAVVSNLDIDDLLSVLDGPRQLGVDALADKNNFDHRIVDQMCPTDTCEDVKLVDSEVWDEAKGQPVCFSLRNQVLLCCISDFWVRPGVQHFQVAVKD